MRRLAIGAKTGLSRKRVTAGLVHFSGFAISVLLLGIVSLVAVPAMIRAGGAIVWGAIALGQAVGLVASIIIVYGWNRSGPAIVARASASMRRREYLDSVRVKFALLIPITACAGLVAGVLTPENWQFAATGATVATLNGLTGTWYFVGIAHSYAYFLSEVVPRAFGTVVGIVLMNSGLSAYVGLACTGAGAVLGFVLATIWVYWSTARAGATPIRGRMLVELLIVQRDGVISSVGTAAYVAVPLAIVSVVAPGSQPAFALADRMFRQFLAAIGPFVSVIQGWVPRAAAGHARARRARAAIAASCGFGTALGIGIVAFGGRLLHWLGDGQIVISFVSVVLIAMLLALSMVDAVLANAVLAALNKLDLAVRAMYVSAVVGLPLVALGAFHFGTPGAIGGIAIGLVLRIVIEFVGFSLSERRSRHANGDDERRGKHRAE